MAHLLIVELPGGNDTDLVRAALARGDRCTLLCADLALYRRQAAVWRTLAAACEFIEVPGFAYDEVQARVLALHALLPVDAVLCLIDIRLTEAARLAQRLGLRFLNPASAALLRDKFSVRQCLRRAGLAQPDFALATSNAGLQQAVAALGLPLIIKPADGYGSQNIVLLQDEGDLDPLLSPLHDLLPCRADYGLGVRANDRLLVERRLHGRLLACDTLTHEGRHSLLGVHEKSVFEPPSFALRGSTFVPGAGLLGAAHGAVERYVFAALDAVGFDCGAAHVELMLGDDGPQLVEINPRLVGAKIPRLVGMARSRSLHDELIALHLGRPVAAVASRPQVAVLRWIVADRAGVLDHVEVPACTDPALRCVEILKQPGEAVRPPLENADRLGYVMVCGAQRQAAQALADRIVAGVRVHLQAAAVAAAPAAGLEFA